MSKDKAKGAKLSGVKVKVCKKCGGVSTKDLKGAVKKECRASGCIGICSKKLRERTRGKVCARVDGRLLACDSKRELLEELSSLAR